MTCNTRLATDAPTPVPTTAPTGIGGTTIDKTAVCEARCLERCGAQPIETCVCDEVTNELLVKCEDPDAPRKPQPPLSVACRGTCAAVCGDQEVIEGACDERDPANVKTKATCGAPPPVYVQRGAATTTATLSLALASAVIVAQC